ncbi:hypothetical protein FZC79_07545 [Rossellomorea vietnamensis]|uniref:Uncharacterized protein n=1 Tax=Rossellomorea vietnamensis TaxID=218284 RepID=A0A5D4KFE2_9BACI|nr:hypothetical protein [Rossellomorea vietnamensis]TYR75998.1 hypothetical protein FZC79_07545 [Rossellomorea vietnamensis]
MNNYKVFIFTFLLLTIAVLGSFASFNYLIDPLWTFSHSHTYNNVQTVIDERQQKINSIHYSDFDYDTLLIGSSRTTYIDQHQFGNMDVYNFSASDLSFKEYPSFINYAKQERGKALDRIIIGIDFFKSSVDQSSEELSLEKYITVQNEPFYRFKNLLSQDVFDYAKKNFRLSKEDKIVELRNYNRENVAYAKELELEAKKKETKEKIEKFRKVFYGKTYEYNPEFKEVLQQLKKENPETEFIIFTTPISSELFTALVEEGRFDDYQYWLSETISVFGGVHNFMYPNSVTDKIENYFDGHHFYPSVGDLIAYKLSDSNSSKVPDDFGVYITDDNFVKHLDMVRDRTVSNN